MFKKVQQKRISGLIIKAAFLVPCCICLVLGCKDKATTGTVNVFAKVIADSATVFEPGVVSSKEEPEFGITFTSGMTTLFFTRKRPGDSYFSIYQADFRDGIWQQVEVASFSGQYFDADPFISPDGNRLFFFSMRPAGMDTVPLSRPNIWYTERSGPGWSAPRLVEGLVNSDTTGEGYMSLSNHGTMYFSSVGRAAGKKHDIFSSARSDQAFEQPQHLDLDIHTNYSNPYIWPDEEFIIVDSRQAGGFGGNDLYYARKLDNNAWSKPINMGSKINTAGDEGTPSLSPDGRWFFFSRNGDIYVISRDELPF